MSVPTKGRLDVISICMSFNENLILLFIHLIFTCKKAELVIFLPNNNNKIIHHRVDKFFIRPRAGKFFICPRVEKFFLPPLTPLQDLEVGKIVTYTAYSIVFIDSVVTSSQNVLDT